MSGGSATLSGCLLEANRAEVGGGLYASGGVALLLTGASLLSGNVADSGSAAYAVSGGTIVYALPAPAGRWILRTGDASGADWAYLLANAGGSGAVSVQTLAQGSTNTERCEPAFLNQTCTGRAGGVARLCGKTDSLLPLTSFCLYTDRRSI